MAATRSKAPLDPTGEARVERWDDHVQVPLTLAALVYFAGYAAPIIEPHLRAPVVRACHVAVLVTWALFIVDYVTRVGLARRRLRYVRQHLLDLAVVVLPFFRPLALLRLTMLLKTFNHQAARSFRDRATAYTLASVVLIVFFGALACLDAERGAPHSNIETFGNAIWWAIVTMTTVGYGDYYPVTVVGRIVAVVLMIGGVALIGVVTATLSSWFVHQVVRRGDATDTDTDTDAGLGTEVGALREEIAQLRAELAALRPGRDG